ncbi:hypothetical protein EVAR_88687_1 [Eumeta japonica]|uniref:Uncharacterized protein n=1 Tax=Eumeta variegata TaxID=151549 RepID=A0A4C1Y014_EUMVA|nr:hypothetical protein EVAR_88687_1 [Eumeta japonica]
MQHRSDSSVHDECALDISSEEQIGIDIRIKVRRRRDPIPGAAAAVSFRTCARAGAGEIRAYEMRPVAHGGCARKQYGRRRSPDGCGATFFYEILEEHVWYTSVVMFSAIENPPHEPHFLRQRVAVFHKHN